MNYKELNLTTDKETITTHILINGQQKDIEIKKYLPIKDKIDLIQVALQQSSQNGIYNEIKLDMYFHLYIVYFYTNLDFSSEDKEDEYKLFDELESNDIILGVVGAINRDEYEKLKYYLNVLKRTNSKYKNSPVALINTVIEELPKTIETAGKMVEGFDKNKYQEVIEFAKAANGNRSIPI